MPFKWTFRAKQIDDLSKEFLFKARCVLRGDIQEEGVDLNPEELFEPVALHEIIRLLLETISTNDLETEGYDIDNAYLFGDLDMSIRMK